MARIINYCSWVSLLLLISCSNLSNFCRHDASLASFGIKEWQQDAAEVLPPDSVADSQASNDMVLRLTWEQLTDVTYQLKFNEQYQMDINYPVFSSAIRALKGKTCAITGYLIPLNPDNGLYAISRYNFASCFFCGRSGPESVVSLKFKNPPRRYKTDEYLTMKGVLELNDKNIRDFIYIFQNTEEFKKP